MTVVSQDSDHAVEQIPSELESPRSKLVYLSLRTGGGRTINDLQVETGLRKLTLHSILRTLQNRDLVHEDGDIYRVTRD